MSGDDANTLAAAAPSRPLRVALIGSRGIPARYGGYETLCDELAGRLTARGFAVTVYCRSHYTPRGLATHRGALLVVLPTLPTKHLDTPVHTFLSCLHAAGEGYDAALVVNSANALFVPLLGLAGTPTALHVDGIEHRRAKWGAFGRAVYASPSARRDGRRRGDLGRRGDRRHTCALRPAQRAAHLRRRSRGAGGRRRSSVSGSSSTATRSTFSRFERRTPPPRRRGLSPGERRAAAG